MASVVWSRPRGSTASPMFRASVALGWLLAAACGGSSSSSTPNTAASPKAPAGPPATGTVAKSLTGAPQPDPRVGLKAGQTDAGMAIWNMKMLSNTPASEKFHGVTNSDLAFRGQYAIQGNYNGYQVWDISNPASPSLAAYFLCPASQSDVSVYANLLFVSGEGNSGRTDCGTQGVKDSVSADRLRGIRILDATDIANPKYIANVQTCRGSHTHTVVTDPNDKENVYIYVSGSAGVRSPSELPGCSKMQPDKDPASALFRIEVIKVPLAHPEQAAIVSSPRIFAGLVAPASHKDAKEDVAEQAKEAADWRAKGGYTATIRGTEYILPPQFVNPMLDSVMKARGGTGSPNGADSAALRAALPAMIAQPVPGGDAGYRPASGPDPVPRHHGVSGYWPRGRRVRRLRPAARHPRRNQPEAHRPGLRLQLLLLALGDVQQRRDQDAVLG